MELKGKGKLTSVGLNIKEILQTAVGGVSEHRKKKNLYPRLGPVTIIKLIGHKIWRAKSPDLTISVIDGKEL